MNQDNCHNEIVLLHQLLAEIGAEVGDIAELPEHTINELRLDSLALLELLMLIDQHIGVEIPVESVVNEMTFGTLAAMINRQRAA